MKARHRRLGLIALGLIALAIASTMVLRALNGSIALFVTPSQIVDGQAPHAAMFRLGGLVEKGSLRRDGMTVHFVITDTAKQVPVTYTGILPDLFAEGRGVVAQGTLGPHGQFRATQVLAKHSADYMPPEAKDAIVQAREASRTLQK
ncbi:MAG: cytochrome c maturation protein CcmE [Betaproteobacteria bacterium]|nr:cytochrome c maturation protein CcmE [Betaproteobacteria bacterium]